MHFLPIENSSESDLFQQTKNIDCSMCSVQLVAIVQWPVRRTDAFQRTLAVCSTSTVHSTVEYSPLYTVHCKLYTVHCTPASALCEV